MNDGSNDGAEGTSVTRRAVLAAGGSLGVAGVAGCIDGITGMIGDEAAKRAVTTTAAMPAAAYGGDSLPEGGIAESDRRDTYVPLSVSAEARGVSGTVALDGFAVTSTLRANNHNTTRSNRYTTKSDRGGAGDFADLYEYLAGDAVIGERFVATVPDARLRRGDDSLAAEMTPARILQYLTRDPGTEVTDEEGRTFRWPDAPRLSAALTIPDDSGGQRDEYDATAQLLALGYEGDVNNATSLLRRSALDSDDVGDAIPSADEWVHVADASARGSGGGPPEEWSRERSSGEASVSPMIVRSIWAQPQDCPRKMPALLYLRRIRHDEQLLFVGGWVVDDNALYHDAVTVLTASGVPSVLGVEVQDSAEAMRTSARKRLAGARTVLGSVTYDGVLGSGALAFLPETHRRGGGRRIFVERVAGSLEARNPQTGKEIKIALRDGDATDEEAVKSLLVPVDSPVIHLRMASGGCECPEPCCCCKILPAANNIPSR
ncbi:MAG: hypothetical protein ABEI57_06135 [Halapricum sp.]